MIEIIKNAKLNKEALVFKNYQSPTVTWEDIVVFLYNESIKPNSELQNRVNKMNNPQALDCMGNLQIQAKLWLAPQTTDLFDIFPGISELLYKLNEEKDNRECTYYKELWHDCSCDWHPQGIRVSMSNRLVPDHHDPHDIFYWQMLGTSFWKINNKTTYILEPGDLLYLPLENSHEVWCDGPRAGLLIDNLN